MTACEVCRGTSAWLDVGGGRLDRCTACGHVRRDLAECPARRADAWGGSGLGERVRGLLTYRSISRAMRGRGVRRVLDVGCGDGALLRRFHDDGADVIGCDPGMLGRPLDPVLDAARRLHPCTLDELPDVGPVDLVVTVHVVEHLPTAVPSLSAMLRRLRPGGTAYVRTPAADSSQVSAFGRAWWMLDDPTHVRFYSARSLELALRAAGASRVEVSRPADDSLMCDALSVASRMRDQGRHGSVAAAAGLAAAPVMLARRTLSAAWRPVIDAVAAV